MRMNRNRAMVAEFHNAFKCGETAMEPTVSTDTIRELRARLILEEAIEFAIACGLSIKCVIGDEVQGSRYINSIDDVKIEIEDATPNLVEMADGLGDIEYVTHGASLLFGFPAEEIFTEIHRSNMSKLADNGTPIVREDGKVMKGPNYFKPRIAKILGVKDD